MSDNATARDSDGRLLRPARQGTPVLLDPRLTVWLSPAFPVGAFAYSHGLEWAAEKVWVRDRATLSDWLRDLLEHGAPHNDLILLAASARAMVCRDWSDIASTNELALALQPAAERHLETVAQGNAFLQAINAAWVFPDSARATQVLAPDAAYPVVVGVVCAAHGIATPAALSAFALAFVSNQVSAAIRLSIIGQTDGQRVIAELMPVIAVTAARAAQSTLDDLGGCALRADVAALAHETQYTRLFRS